MPNKNRVKGALYGVAVGDALGAPLEFMTARQIRDLYHSPVDRMIGGGWLNIAPGETTDDTAMTLAVAEGIMAGYTDSLGQVIKEIGDRFICWLETKPIDVGNTCQEVILEAKQNLKTGITPKLAWKEAARRYHVITNGRSGGNGALMRTVPVAIAYEKTNAFYYGGELAKMTHYDEKAAFATGSYNEIISQIVRTPSYERNAKVNRWIQTAYKVTTPVPTGGCIDSLSSALWAIRQTHSFKDALVTAVNLGGDADTIGAITGGLAGALYGFKAIPDKWVQALSQQEKSRIDAFVDWSMENAQK